MKYASDQTKSFTLTDPESRTAVKIIVTDWSGYGWTDWISLEDIILTSDAGQYAADEPDHAAVPSEDTNVKGHKEKEIPDVNGKEDEKSGQQDSGTDAENDDNAESTENAGDPGGTEDGGNK